MPKKPDEAKAESVLMDLLSCWELTPPEVQIEGSQIYNGKWYAPKWGCDTLQHMLDIVESS